MAGVVSYAFASIWPCVALIWVRKRLITAIARQSWVDESIWLIEIQSFHSCVEFAQLATLYLNLVDTRYSYNMKTILIAPQRRLNTHRPRRYATRPMYVSPSLRRPQSFFMLIVGGNYKKYPSVIIVVDMNNANLFNQQVNDENNLV